MRMFAKAGLGMLVLASLGAGVVSPSNAQAYIEEQRPAVAIAQRDACSRAPELRPIWCYRRHPRGFAWGWRYKTEANRAADQQQQRQAILEHRYRDYRH